VGKVIRPVFGSSSEPWDPSKLESPAWYRSRFAAPQAGTVELTDAVLSLAVAVILAQDQEAADAITQLFKTQQQGFVWVDKSFPVRFLGYLFDQKDSDLQVARTYVSSLLG